MVENRRLSEAARRWACSTLIAAALCLPADVLFGQTLVYDQAAGLFTLSYVDDDGVSQSVQIVPPNRVGPVFDVTITDAGSGLFDYAYSFGNTGPGAQQGIFAIELGCPPVSENVSLAVPPGWNLEHAVSFTEPGAPVCEFVRRTAADVVPVGGALVGFSVSSEFLPGVDSTRVWGQVDIQTTLPGLLEVGPEFADLLDAAEGLTGGWFETASVTPKHDPAAVTGAQGIAVTLAETIHACSLGWISANTCASVQGALNSAQSSLTQGDSASAASALQTVIDELNVERGTTVNENAFWLLSVNSEHLVAQLPVVEAAVFLVIDGDGIAKGEAPNFFSDQDVNADLADLGVRSQLRFFMSNVGQTITLYSGEVGDEGWFAVPSVPSTWDNAGPTADGVRNFIGNPSIAFPHNVGPGLGSGSNPEAFLDNILGVTPLRATGLKALEGLTVCAVVFDSDISINYGPLEGSLKGATLGTVGFEVLQVTKLTGGSSSALPKVDIRIVDANDVCEGSLEFFTDAPEPTSSSDPFDTDPGS